MTPEEKFNRDIWWILQEIRKDELLTPEGKSIKFDMRVLDHYDKTKKLPLETPEEKTQKKLLFKLEEWGVLNFNPVDDLSADVDIFDPAFFALSLKKPEFDNLYAKYEKLFGFENLKSEKSENIQTSRKVHSILLVTPEHHNFDFFWVVFNHNYEHKNKMYLKSKHSGRNDGIGSKLWQLCQEKQIDFDRGFLDYMNNKIFALKPFENFEKTKLLKMSKNKLQVEDGISLERQTKQLLEPSVMKHFA